MSTSSDEPRPYPNANESRITAINSSAAEILESMSDAFIAIDRDWHYTYANGAAERLLGQPREKLRGQSVWGVFPRPGSGIDKACRRAMEQRTTVRFGEYDAPLDIWLEGAVYPSVDGIAVYAQDITERKRAEEALRESNERFRRYFELGLIGMSITSPSKGMIEVNDELCSILGYERDELLQKTWAELTHPDDLALDVAYFNKVLAGEIDGYSIDKRWIRKDKRIIDATISVKCLRHADGSVDYFIGLLQDITERKRAEETLREQERFIRRITELTPVVLDVFDFASGRHSYLTSDVVRLYGYTREEFAQMEDPFSVLVHPEDLPLLRQSRERLRKGNESQIVEFEGRIRRRDGEWRWIASRSLPFTSDENGQVLQVVTAAFDVTDRKRAEAALQESERRYELVSRATNDLIWDWDLVTDTVRWNQAIQTVFGYPPELIGSDFAWRLDRIHPEDRAHVVSGIREAIGSEFHAHGDYWRCEYRFQRADGSYAAILDRGFILHDEFGKSIRFVGSIIDLTEQRNAEAERERLLRELERSNEELAQFAYVVSHDLQAPLRMVKSYAQLLEARIHGQINQTTDEFLRTMIEGTETMEQLIRGLLRYAKLGEVSDELSIVSMNDLVQDVLLTLEPELSETAADVKCGDLPAVSANKLQLRQVLQNLISNAIKYRSPDRPLKIGITATRRGDEYVFAVSDNGLGVPQEQRERIFQPLKRLHGADIPGIGLGLAVCKRIVERHGGRIWVESEPGAGSVFYFTMRT